MKRRSFLTSTGAAGVPVFDLNPSSLPFKQLFSLFSEYNCSQTHTPSTGDVFKTHFKKVETAVMYQVSQDSQYKNKLKIRLKRENTVKEIHCIPNTHYRVYRLFNNLRTDNINIFNEIVNDCTVTYQDTLDCF